MAKSRSESLLRSAKGKRTMPGPGKDKHQISTTKSRINLEFGKWNLGIP
jgi:hypothetical protein